MKTNDEQRARQDQGLHVAGAMAIAVTLLALLTKLTSFVQASAFMLQAAFMLLRAAPITNLKAIEETLLAPSVSPRAVWSQ